MRSKPHGSGGRLRRSNGLKNVCAGGQVLRDAAARAHGWLLCREDHLHRRAVALRQCGEHDRALSCCKVSHGCRLRTRSFPAAFSHIVMAFAAGERARRLRAAIRAARRGWGEVRSQGLDAVEQAKLHAARGRPRSGRRQCNCGRGDGCKTGLGEAGGPRLYGRWQHQAGAVRGGRGAGAGAGARAMNEWVVRNTASMHRAQLLCSHNQPPMIPPGRGEPSGMAGLGLFCVGP